MLSSIRWTRMHIPPVTHGLVVEEIETIRPEFSQWKEVNALNFPQVKVGDRFRHYGVQVEIYAKTSGGVVYGPPGYGGLLRLIPEHLHMLEVYF